MEIANILTDSELLDMYHHFKSGGRFRRPLTWHQKCEGEVIKSRPDYFLCSDRRIIRRYRIRDPRHFTTDHKLVYGTLISNTLKEIRLIFMVGPNFPTGPPKWDLHRDWTVYVMMLSRQRCHLFPPRKLGARVGSLKHRGELSTRRMHYTGFQGRQIRLNTVASPTV